MAAGAKRTDRPTTADAAIDQIRLLLLRGDLRPGERLPPEEEFRRRLGVSRNAYREALKALELVGVVNVRHGSGTRIADLDADDFVRSFDLVVGLHGRDEALHLLEIRRILESAAVTAAAARLDAEDIAALRERTATIGPGTPPDVALAYDVDFHRALLSVHGNPYLRALLDRLATHTLSSRIDRAVADPASVVTMVREHTAILDALRARDPGLATALVAAHIHGVESWVRTLETPPAGTAPPVEAAPPAGTAPPVETSRRRPDRTGHRDPRKLQRSRET